MASAIVIETEASVWSHLHSRPPLSFAEPAGETVRSSCIAQPNLTVLFKGVVSTNGLEFSQRTDLFQQHNTGLDIGVNSISTYTVD